MLNNRTFPNILRMLIYVLVFFSFGYQIFQPEPSLAQEPTEAKNSSLVTLEIHYDMPEAAEVYLVWGVDGWSTMEAHLRPSGTFIKDDVMHTPMKVKNGLFVARVQAPHGAKVDVGFLITKKQNGASIKALWDGDEDYQLIAGQKDVVEIETTLSLARIEEGATVSEVLLFAFLSISIVFGLAVVIIKAPQKHNRYLIAVGIISLIAVGLLLRLWVAWDKNQLLPDTPGRLFGDETGYAFLADSLIKGSFFQWPGRAPIYPLFLALSYLLFGHSYAIALYVQAFVATTSIPLTYVLARRFIGKRGALLAAALIALHPALIYHVTLLYTEAIYTPLLLITIISLLWALETPKVHRFALAGVLLAILTLCRPTTILFPIVLIPLLNWNWDLKQRLLLFGAYVSAMVVVIAPWTYHNYRTYDAFLPVSVSTAVLWQGSPEFYHLMKEKRTLQEVWDVQLNPDKNGGHDVFTIEGDHYFNAKAINSIMTEPGIYALYVSQKLLYFWIGHPAADWPNYAFFSLEDLLPNFPAWQIVGIYFTRLLPFVALIGLFILRRCLGSFIPLLVVCVYFMGISAVTYATVRYSEPLHPILVIIVVTAASVIWRSFHDRFLLFSGFESRTKSLDSLNMISSKE